MRNLGELLNLVKELIVPECLKKSGLISGHRLKVNDYQKATNETKKPPLQRTGEKSLPFSNMPFILTLAMPSPY